MRPPLGEVLKWPARGYADTQALAAALRSLQEAGWGELPLPGSGRTLERWRALAAVGGHDLGLCKLYEGHTDALAIMAELGAPGVPDASTWGTWAAEPPNVRLSASRKGQVALLEGRKAWCSGAAVVSHALVTCWDEDGEQQLVSVALGQPGITVTGDGWNAVGMAATASVEVIFENAEGQFVGKPGQYVGRPGFWQGGIGIAACWLGAAQSLASVLHHACQARPEPHALAHLGSVDAALHGAACALREAAAEIDQAPSQNAELLARRARAVVEECVESVIRHTGRALGAGPYCKNPHFARLVADLPVFVRQSHAERDLAALGQLASAEPTNTKDAWPWPL
jgi:alkylation response protein AidB-like acyl-CoA dehydrogenase